MSDLEPTQADVYLLILAAETLADALECVPDDWIIYFSGPRFTGYSAALLPSGLDSSHVLYRLHIDSGLSFGSGCSLLDAIKSASNFALKKCRVVSHVEPDQAPPHGP